MKIQMEGQSLRIRISEAELASLQSGAVVEDATAFPGGRLLRHAVRLGTASEPALATLADGWAFHVPADALDAYVARLPCRDGLLFRLPVDAGQALEVSFEVDVRDSVRSRGVVKPRAR